MKIIVFYINPRARVSSASLVCQEDRRFLKDKLMLRNLFGLAVVVVGAFLMTACVHDEAHRLYLDEPLPSKPSSSVEVLFEEPDRPYDVIADLQARNGSIEYLRKEAAKIGADAVLCSFVGGKRDLGDKWADQDTSKTYQRIAGTAIIFRD